MPTAPYFKLQRQKSSPRSQLNREIFEVKRRITQIECEIEELDAKINTLETQKGDFMARAGKEPSFWQRFDDTTRLIQTLSDRGVADKNQIIQEKDRLSWLEKKLEMAEEAAAERAKGILWLINFLLLLTTSQLQSRTRSKILCQLKAQILRISLTSASLKP